MPVWCTWRLADLCRRPGITQGRVSAIEHAKPGATELCIIADFGDQRLVLTEPGIEAA